MGQAPRQLPDGRRFHITLRCNSRAFLIHRGVRRDLLLAVLRKGQEKFGKQNVAPDRCCGRHHARGGSSQRPHHFLTWN
jgi:hypothetical protein